MTSVRSSAKLLGRASKDLTYNHLTFTEFKSYILSIVMTSAVISSPSNAPKLLFVSIMMGGIHGGGGVLLGCRGHHKGSLVKNKLKIKKKKS